jgi:hypothetical protein
MHDRFTPSSSARDVEVEIAPPTLSKRFDSVHMPFMHFTASGRPARPRGKHEDYSEVS